MNKLDDSYEMLDDSVEPVKRAAWIVPVLVLVLLVGVMVAWVLWNHSKNSPSVPTMANKTENNQPAPVNTPSPDTAPSPPQVLKPAETTINFEYNSADINAIKLQK